MLSRPTRLPHVLTAALLCAPIVPSSADDVADPGDAAGYLELESVLDGRCQILSEGGKLRVLHNRHGSSTIAYRLLRTFAGKQQGLSVGEIAANAEPAKLGCTRVDGRPQDWLVERASFKPEE